MQAPSITICYSDAPLYKLVMVLCCASCCASRSEGPTLVHTLVQPVFLLSNHYANTKAGTQVATLAKHVPTLDMAHKLHPCKTHANSGPGTDVATQAKHVPTLRPSKTHANFWLCKSRANVRPGEGVDSCRRWWFLLRHKIGEN